MSEMTSKERAPGGSPGTPVTGGPSRLESLVYRHCYATADLSEMLASPDTRSKIRRLPGPQLYFGLQELSDEETAALLPHITEEQWTTVLDLDLWSRDRAQLKAFVGRHRHLLHAPDAVARKLLRGVDPELWQLLFRRHLKVFRRTEEEFEGEPGEREEWFTTPDGDYLLVFPESAEFAGLLRALILRLYQLDPQGVRLGLESAMARTSIELEEHAYQERKRRVEDLGFQDYFDALSIYTYIDQGESLPAKDWTGLREISTLPAQLQASSPTDLLLFQAIQRLQQPRDSELLLEEIAFVANKVLAADRISPSSPRRVKHGIRKALLGINLGLEAWSKGELAAAEQGIQAHFLQSFFQFGYSRLIDLRRAAKLQAGGAAIPPGSFQEAFLEGLLKPYPLRTVRTRKGFRRRFLRTRRELEICSNKLDRMSRAG